jgi:hypothetical protein
MSVRYLAENHLAAGTRGRLSFAVGSLVNFVAAVSQFNSQTGDDLRDPLAISSPLCGSVLVSGGFGAMVLAPAFSDRRVLVKYTLERDLPDDPTTPVYHDRFWD